MKLFSVNQLLFVFLVILAGNQIPLFGQMTEELKKFLWEKEITEILSAYGEDRIILSDSGDYRHRLARRTFREAQGLRIQAFAGTDVKNAENIIEDNRKKISRIEDEIMQNTDKIKTRKEANKLIGRTVCWITPTGRDMKGVISRAHGNNGAVRALFKEGGVPGQALGQKVRIISKAPSWKMLTEYGGYLSIEEFRSSELFILDMSDQNYYAKKIITCPLVKLMLMA